MEKIKFYGTRGSSSLSSEKYMEFGCATTCVLFNFDRTHIMVDCGSGVNNALKDLENVKELHLLISHTHLDHISGITNLLQAFKDKELHIYGKAFNGVKIKDVIASLTSKSLWPVSANSYKNVKFHNIDDTFSIDRVRVSNMDSNHPGNCSLFRLDTKDYSIVTAFDFSHLDGFEQKLKRFAKGCDTFIYDGCFSQEELKERPSWGHSTPAIGARIGQEIGAKNVIITHFGPYDDETLAKWEKDLQKFYPNVSFARSGESHNELKKIVEIGTLLGLEKDNDALLTKIVETCMEITNADGGTLYLLDNNKLDFKVMINKSKGTKLIKKDESLNIPPVDINAQNVSAACAREKKLINIDNCYLNLHYDFSGVIKYDKMNKYLTKSVIVVPLIDESNDVVGVLQLINAMKDKEIVSFAKKDEEILSAIANQASMSIVNATYSQKIDDLLYGFVKVMSLGIDERTPYNANHTKNMVLFADNFLKYENNKNGKYAVDSFKKREILMSVWLHDIGKILTPIDIMNKDSRLGDEEKTITARFERMDLLLQLELAKGEITNKQYKEKQEERAKMLETILLINKAGYLTDDCKNKLDYIAKQTYKEVNGDSAQVISEHEYHQLSILKGTLNKEERSVMESHVAMTQKFLSQLNFPKHYENIPAYAGNHHEFLDGSGYPNHLTKDELSWPCRLITICDIYEALVAKDRPYKKPFTSEEAIKILREMAEKGQIDKELVEEFVCSL